MPKYKSNLQAMRKRAGFKSAREFAEYANINVKTYTNHEQGDASMSLLQAWEYADLLNCTIDEIAGRAVESLTSDEHTVLDGYRVADQKQKRRMLATAQLELDMAEEDAIEKSSDVAAC